MLESVHIPLFPLNILPLEGERIPLHIFEPRYRQLVEDLQAGLDGFGVLYAGQDNQYMMGTFMRLRKILKTYDTGESDILCVGHTSFLVTSYKKEFPGKLYPGGEVVMLDYEPVAVSESFDSEFREYMGLKNQPDIEGEITLFEIANELDLDMPDRLKYLQLLKGEKREKFLFERLRFQRYLLQTEQKFRRSYLYN